MWDHCGLGDEGVACFIGWFLFCFVYKEGAAFIYPRVPGLLPVTLLALQITDSSPQG